MERYIMSQLNYAETKLYWETTACHSDMSGAEFYADHISQVLNIKLTDSILDIGCGDGQIDQYILSKSSSVSGYDFSEKHIKSVRTLLASSDYWNQSFLESCTKQFDKRTFLTKGKCQNITEKKSE
jgi:cyclopropane fatty-acyl-phospholipid synthase-like methyltransferase